MIVNISQPYAIYEIGQRDNQEDSIYPKYREATEKTKVFVLCDGMGGHERGEVASSLVCDFISLFILDNWDENGFTDSMLLEAINGALDKLESLNDDTSRRPGTTLTLLVFHKGGVLAAHIGDSRIYHLRPSENTILYKSRDHSQVYDMLAAGEISLSEMNNYKKKNVITRAMVPGQDRRPKPSIAHITDLQEGDYFFMCSDGILEQMSDKELLERLSGEKTDEEKIEGIIECTADNKDNHSAYMIRIAEVIMEEGDDMLKNDEQTTPSNSLLLEKDAVVGDIVLDNYNKKEHYYHVERKKILYISISLVVILFLFLYIFKVLLL